MSIQATCPSCLTQYNLPDALAGKKVRCKQCERPFVAVAVEPETHGPDSKRLKSPASAGDSPAAAAAGSPSGEQPVPSPGAVEHDEPIMAKSVKEPAELKDKLQSEARPVRVVAAVPAQAEPRPRRVTAAPRGRGDDDRDDIEPAVSVVAAKPSRSPMLAIGLIGGGIAVVLGLILVVGLGSYFFFRAMRNKVAQAGGPLGGAGSTTFGAPQNVDQALAQLKNDDAAARKEAASWLAQAVRDEGRRGEVTEALQPTLKDGDLWVRNAGVKAMRTWGPTKDHVPALIGVLKDQNNETREVAIHLLGDLKDPQAAQAIAERLPDFFDRGHASRALRDIGPPAEKAVLPYLFHPDGGVQGEARALLKAYGTKQNVILDQALTDLKSSNANVRKSVAEWLAKANPNTDRRGDVARALESSLSEQDWGARGAGMDALAVWATKDNVPALLDALKDDNVHANDIRHRSMRILGKLKDERAAAPLCQRLSNFFDRDEASKALQELGPVAEKEVAKHLFDKDAGIREKADLLLKGYGTKEEFILNQAISVLSGNETDRRKSAAEWLAQQNPNDKHRKQIAKALDRLTTDVNGETRVAGLKALKVWATTDNIPALINVLKDDNIFNRDARIAAMQVLASLKDEQGAEPVVLRVASIHDRAEAVKALVAMGPVAEKSVILGIGTTKDDGVATELCKVLGEIGTKLSVPILTRATKSMNRNLAQAALVALKEVNARQGDGGK
jgi:predicted Zn finger-like uncharacterized protein